VLILDDSTSSVDVETSGRIHMAIKDLTGHSTRFIIAQRVSTLLEADKIVVLDDGCIAAEGTHGELLASSPIYREIYESQLGGGGFDNE
jgi:ATP-binding cassette subfamily B multidrug efflux pump